MATGTSPVAHSFHSDMAHILSNLDTQAASTRSPYQKRALAIRKCIIRCCGTCIFDPTETGCCARCKGKSVKWLSNGLSGAATVILSIVTLGYCGWKEYQAQKLNKTAPIRVRAFLPPERPNMS